MRLNTNPDSYSPNSHGGTLERLLLLGNPAFTTIARIACYEWAVWPEELLGRDRAGDAVPDDDALPVAYRSTEPSRLGHVVLARRAAWHMTSQLTTSPAREVGDVFGGHKPSTVRPFMGKVEIFDRIYPIARPPMSHRVRDLGIAAKFVMEMKQL